MNLYNRAKNGLDYYNISFSLVQLHTMKHIAEKLTEDFSEQVELFEKLLYADDYSKLHNLHRVCKYQDFLGVDFIFDSMISQIFILISHEYHRKYVKQYRLTEEQIDKQKKHIKECFDKKQPEDNLSSLFLSAHFVRARIIDIGHLQYQYHSGETDNAVVRLHISPGKRMEIEKVIESFNCCGKVLKYHYGITGAVFQGESWMFSPQLHLLLDKGTNLYRFYELFDVERKENAESDMLWLVFGVRKCDNLCDLAENTSLQRLIKKEWLNGKIFYRGKATLKEEFLPEEFLGK